MAAVPTLAWLLADTAEEGKHILLGMLLTGLVFVGVIALGELSRSMRHRKRH